LKGSRLMTCRDQGRRRLRRNGTEKQARLILGICWFGILHLVLESARAALENHLCLAIEIFRT
jgi:hypothetical protein